jgi:V/A-type H+-transporting ATPase subunit I
MITPMRKVFVVSRAADRDPLLAALRDLGAVHLAPVDPAKAVPDAETTATLDRMRRAVQVLAEVAPRGSAPDLSPAEAAEEVLRIQRESVERAGRLSALHLQLEQLAIWGETRREDLQTLQDAGVRVAFYAVPRKTVDQVQAECVQVLGPWPGRRMLVAVAARTAVSVPQGAEALPLPERDRPGIRAEASEIDQALARDADRLAALARLVPVMEKALPALREKAAWTLAARGALDDPHLAAIQGWAPAEKADALAARLAEAGVQAAVQASDPAPGEEPPTLIRYNWFTRPMKGLFDILGTVPGYREFDVSTVFMIFLPVFSAILISDTGYGLLYLLLPAVFYRRMAAGGAKALAQLVMAIGACSVIWGVLTCSLFGFGFAWVFGRAEPFIPVTMKKESMDLLMWISITLGAVQLSLAHLWKAKAAFPRLNFLSEAGWAAFLWGMYGVVKMLLLKDPPKPADLPAQTYYCEMLVIGGLLAIVFAVPHRNPLKMLGLGLANFPLSAIGTFGDTVSYIRLMAIGLAGSALAMVFNQMAGRLPWYVAVLILLAAHGLNVSLSIISLFAHGVRLNMLEFSNNLGMQWSGYAYEPFAKRHREET